MVSFVLAVEHVGFKFTMLVGIAIGVSFTIGEAILGIEAAIVRDWRSLQILAHLPLLGTIFFLNGKRIKNHKDLQIIYHKSSLTILSFSLKAQ